MKTIIIDVEHYKALRTVAHIAGQITTNQAQNGTRIFMLSEMEDALWDIARGFEQCPEWTATDRLAGEGKCDLQNSARFEVVSVWAPAPVVVAYSDLCNQLSAFPHEVEAASKLAPRKSYSFEYPFIIAECVANKATIRAALSCPWANDWTPEQKALIQKAASVGLVSWASMSQYHITKKGVEVFAASDTAETAKPETVNA